MFLKNSDGEKSMTATMSIVAFIVVMLKFLLNGSVVQLGSFTYAFGSIGATEIAAVLSPILGTYAVRRYTETRYGGGGDPFNPYGGQSYQEDIEVGDAGGKPGDGAL